MRGKIFTKAGIAGLAAVAVLALPGMGKAAEVFNCTETVASGVNFTQEGAEAGEFEGSSFTMEFLSNVEMLMDHPRRPSSTGLGKRESFLCDKPYPNLMPDMLVCTDGAEMLVFDQDSLQFNWGYLFGQNVTTYGAPNAFVAVGECSR